jgi:hypothetical protein
VSQELIPMVAVLKTAFFKNDLLSCFIQQILINLSNVSLSHLASV